MKKTLLTLALCLAAMGAQLFAATVFTDEQGVTFEYAGAVGKITGYTGAQPNVVITSPMKHDSKEFYVTRINKDAFSNSKIESIVLPEDLKVIDEYAFYKCAKLYKVEFAKGTLLDTIKNRAFSDCTSLIEINIPFRKEGSGADEEIKPKMHSSGSYYYHFQFVPNIKMPSLSRNPKGYPWGAKYINAVTEGYMLFYPNDAKDKSDLLLCASAARGTITIPASVTKIRSKAFENCENMTSVIIPASIKEVESRIFENCTGLISIVCKCTTPPVCATYDDKNPEFLGVDKTIPVYVPEGTIDAYKNAKGWNQFSNYQVWTEETEEELSKVTLTLSVNDATMGSVKGAGVYTSGQDVTIEAIPAEGYKFIQWSDNNSETPRTLKVTRSMELTAVFADKSATGQFTLTLLVNDPNMGEVSGGGAYNEGDIANIEATAKEGYVFKHWSDGNKLYRRAIQIEGNLTLTATFEANVPAGTTTFTITASAKDPATGSVQGGGVYGENAVIKLLAIPSQGYEFVQWTDGDKNNPRTITVTADAAYVAEFGPKPEGIESVQNSEVSVQKVIENGVLYLMYKGTKYDVQGKRIY